MKINYLFIFLAFFISLLSKPLKSLPVFQNEKESSIRPVNLRCEYLKNPLGIDLPLLLPSDGTFGRSDLVLG